MYVKTCERGRVKDFEQPSLVSNAVRYNAFSRGPRRPRYNGFAVYTTMSNVFTLQYLNFNKNLLGMF